MVNRPPSWDTANSVSLLGSMPSECTSVPEVERRPCGSPGGQKVRPQPAALLGAGHTVRGWSRTHGNNKKLPVARMACHLLFHKKGSIAGTRRTPLSSGGRGRLYRHCLRGVTGGRPKLFQWSQKWLCIRLPAPWFDAHPWGQSGPPLDYPDTRQRDNYECVR